MIGWIGMSRFLRIGCTTASRRRSLTTAGRLLLLLIGFFTFHVVFVERRGTSVLRLDDPNVSRRRSMADAYQASLIGIFDERIFAADAREI